MKKTSSFLSAGAGCLFIALALSLAACSSPPIEAASVSTATAVSVTATEPAQNLVRPSPTVHAAVSPTPGASPTLVPSATPTAQIKAVPTLGRYFITPLPDATLVTPIPTPVNAVELPTDVINILLIGTDYRAGDNTLRTDTLIVASVNKKNGTVSLLSIPRDLFVYIPTFGMGRINQAFNAGKDYPGGGPALVEQTLLYNLGLPVHYYASVNFAGFRAIVDALGGVEVPVNCQVTEYKLKDWSLDESDPANYELYTQPVGVAKMDGALALWYARARPVGGDFFRSYRQRQVLRAIYRAGKQGEVMTHIPELYAAFDDVVDSDLGLWDVMQFVPMAPNLSETSIRTLAIGPNQTTGWVTPKGDAVLLPRPEAIQAIVNELLADDSTNQVARTATMVEVWNAAAPEGWETLAAETLRNEGFASVAGLWDGTPYTRTTIIDFTTSAKGSPIKRLQSVLHVADHDVVAQPDAQSAVAFRVILGSDYNACPRLDWMDPLLLATPTPQP